MEVATAKQILIVDDSPEIRGLYKRLLAKAPGVEYEFAEASSAEEGLNTYNSLRPDCILLDYSMSGMNGLEFIKAISEDSGFVPVPIVMISGQGDERIAVEAIKRGASDYLVKNSIEKEAIRLAVSNALNEAEVQRRLNQKLNRFSSGAFLNVVPGTIVGGRYTVIRCLGAGGMGKVYVCRDEGLNGHLIAMKVLFSDVAQDETVIKRFRNEILAAYTVSHPNVVRAFQYFTEHDISAFTMEFVNGGSLADRLDMSGKLRIDETIDFLVQICSGLQAIHDAGIIHRDLKPSNILITTNGEIKITDFGIARRESSEEVTQSGAILGTLSYLSPEYLSDATVSEKSDIYSIGIIAYEMITGILPNEDLHIFTSLKNRVEEDPKPPQLARPDCPTELSQFVMRTLQRNPADRFQSAKEMVAELQKIQANLVAASA